MQWGVRPHCGEFFSEIMYLGFSHLRFNCANILLLHALFFHFKPSVNGFWNFPNLIYIFFPVISESTIQKITKTSAKRTNPNFQYLLKTKKILVNLKSKNAMSVYFMMTLFNHFIVAQVSYFHEKKLGHCNQIFITFSHCWGLLIGCSELCDKPIRSL